MYGWNDSRLDDEAEDLYRVLIKKHVKSPANKLLLQEVIESMGHKQYTRQHCDYTWNGLKETLPSAFDSISLQTIRKYALRSKRFMD